MPANTGARRRKNRRKVSFTPARENADTWRADVQRSIKAKFRFLDKEVVKQLTDISLRPHLNPEERIAAEISVLHNQLYNNRLSEQDRLKVAQALRSVTELLVTSLKYPSQPKTPIRRKKA